ncbi:Uu.00g118000.m01.CDS01 [Anthostomella pinea]|uniref:Uu.00g118000.m01.CDS01 n=1 Tax=Anthostomella pinea TaxID=933095 RepID=A0AAI8VH15_9PEZI|nr:Uu.00g118000.m01.CDS01 [Anthostomella pinea]
MSAQTEDVWSAQDQNEDSPLLGPEADAPSSSSSPAKKTSDGDTWRYDVVMMVAAIVFFLEVGSYMTVPSRNKIMEQNICRAHYPDLVDDQSTLEDSLCRGPEVQGKIASLNGWTYMLECIPGLLTAIPYGVATDRFGRKPLLAIALFGYMLYLLWMIVILALPAVFPIELYLLGPLFLFIGGELMNSVFYTMGADVVPAAKMAVVYLQLGAVSFGGELVGAQVGGVATDRDPWLSLLLGFGLIVIAFLGIFLLPETMHLRTEMISDVDSPIRLTDEPSEDLDEDASPRKTTRVLREGFGLMKGQLKEAVTVVYGNSHLMLLLLALTFAIAGKFISNILLQYAMKRYDISWGRAAELVSLRSVFVIIWQLAVLPMVSWLLVTKAGLTPVVKDLWLGRGSVFGLSIGSLLVAFAATPAMLVFALVVLSLGFSFPYIIRSVLNTLVDEQYVGTLNATIGLCEKIGIMVASPIMSSLLKKGMELGDGWMGLPFFFAAGVFSVSALIVWVFRLRPGEPH